MIYSKRAFLILLICIPVLFSLHSIAQNLAADLQRISGTMSARINQYDPERYNFRTGCKSVELVTGNETLEFEGTKWAITSEVKPMEKAGKYEVTVSYSCLKGEIPDASVSVDFIFRDWSTENYVLMPAAAYNGNRYPAIVMDYLPFFNDPKQLGLNNTILLSDQPRLNYRDGFSRIQERSGDMSLPSLGFRKNKTAEGFFLCFGQAGDYGDYGIDIEENRSRDKAVVTLTSPVVREVQRYWFCRMDVKPSTDKTVTFKAGDKTQVIFIIDFFSCPKVQTLFDELKDLRVKHYLPREKPNLIPFSAIYKIQEGKFNSENWRKAGYYAVFVDTVNIRQDWQIGLMGGMITTLPLLAEGSPETRARVLRNFDWLFPNGISPSGYYYDAALRGKFEGIFPNKALGKDLHLVRKNADATYFIFKQLDLMQKMNITVKPSWLEGNLKALNAQVGTWKKYGQLGQYVNQVTGELVVGNTTSAGIFPASLCSAYRLTGDTKYMKTAADIADFYYNNFISKGIVCGGTSDVVQSFDSECSYGLLESLVELYEITQVPKWLTRSEEMARQFATWIVAYDYKFPPETPHGKLDIRSTGGVFANTQNKTAPAGIANYSGLALLKLYRAGKDPFFLTLLRDIAHAMPQFMSWKEHPIPGFHDGWITERCNMSDWLEGVGQTILYSCWAETSMLLTIVELPGVYVDLDAKRVVSMDHIKATLTKTGNGKFSLSLFNPTIYDARVKVLAETGEQAKKPLGMNAFLDWPKVDVPAGKTITLKLN